MEKIVNGVKIEYKNEDQKLVFELEKQLNKKAPKILKFFELEKSKDFKIKIWNDLDEYVEFIKGFLEDRKYQPWMIAHTYDGNINILALKYVTKVKGHEEDTEKTLAIDACHEFVHICHQTATFDRELQDDGWFWEGLAVVLGNPEGSKWAETEYFEHADLKKLPSIKYLEEKFDDINGYKYAYLIVKYMLKNLPHKQVFGYVKNPSSLKDDEETILQQATVYWENKLSNKKEC